MVRNLWCQSLKQSGTLVCGGVTAGMGSRDTPQVRPCRLRDRLRECAILRTRQGRGWASCPARPTHASDPCGGGSREPIPAVPWTLRRRAGEERAVGRLFVEGRRAWLGITGRTNVAPRRSRAERCSAALAPPPLTAPGLPTNCLGAVGVGLWGPEPHGCGDGAYMDVLAACPITPPPPTHLRNPSAPTHLYLRTSRSTTPSSCGAGPWSRNRPRSCTRCR